jgi:hypothetical protein
VREAADACTCGAEAEHVTVGQDAPTDWPTVHSRAVGGQSKVGDVHVWSAPYQLSVQPRDALIVKRDVDAFAAPDRGDFRGELEHLAGVLDAQVRRIHVRAPNRSVLCLSCSTYPSG